MNPAAMRYLTALITTLGLMWIPSHAQAEDAGDADKTFHDCTGCPEMVVIPSGYFKMGSPASGDGRSDDVGPVHQVKVAAFAMGKTEVTRGQFAEFIKRTRYNTGDKCWTLVGRKFELRSGSWREPGYFQTDKHPVACINWNDANAYAEWLSRKTGKHYRLPTEAEWEYSARGQSSTARYWGDNPDKACRFANAADKTLQATILSPTSWLIHNCTDGYAYTAPVGRFKANAFGLYDMLGNVWEWTEDSYHDSYKGAPNDGSAWQGDDEKRVIRGGSWYDAPSYVRADGRDKAPPASRYSNFGFRLVRTLP